MVAIVDRADQVEAALRLMDAGNVIGVVYLNLSDGNIVANVWATNQDDLDDLNAFVRRLAAEMDSFVIEPGKNGAA